ncbi:MAG: site-2 protease family protein [Candidatus Hecatellaceae archaeon]
MGPLEFEALPVILSLFMAFWMALYWVGRRFKLERYGVDVKPFILIYRTARFNRLLDSLAQRLGKVLPALSNLSLALGFGMMAFGTYVLTRNLYFFFYKVEKASPVLPAVPLITIRESLPYFLIAVAVLIAVHELAHGVVARFEGIKVKTAGILLAAIIPGGFVEPDEAEFKQAERGKRLRVLAVGSAANLALALLIIPIMVCCFQPSGVMVGGVVEGWPAEKAGLKPGMIIEAVNGVKTPDLEALRQQIQKVGVGGVAELRVRLPDGSSKVFRVMVSFDPDDPDRPIIGITKASTYIPFFPVFVSLYWLHFWSLNVAIFNMLPIYPLDGDGVVYNLVERYLKGKTKFLRAGLTGFYVALLALNVGLTFGTFGWVSF